MLCTKGLTRVSLLTRISLLTQGAGKLTVEKDKAKDVPSYPVSFENDPGSNNSGYYELRAVLTHKGRSSDSGHYVAWVKTDEGGR